jgi:hypothetical protein
LTRADGGKTRGGVPKEIVEFQKLALDVISPA